MMSFQEFVSVRDSVGLQPARPAGAVTKWKATKEQIVDYWRNLRADTPIQVVPIDKSHRGSTYGEDGMRLTGSPQFIGSVLARLKELLNYETPTTNLSLTYRQTESPSKAAMGQSKTSYVFYAATRQRGEA